MNFAPSSVTALIASMDSITSSSKMWLKPGLGYLLTSIRFWRATSWITHSSEISYRMLLLSLVNWKFCDCSSIMKRSLQITIDYSDLPMKHGPTFLVKKSLFGSATTITAIRQVPISFVSIIVCKAVLISIPWSRYFPSMRAMSSESDRVLLSGFLCGNNSLASSL